MQDLENKRWHIPYVIEPSAGVDRGVLAIMNEAYKVEILGERLRANGHVLQAALGADQGRDFAPEAKSRGHSQQSEGHQERSNEAWP